MAQSCHLHFARTISQIHALLPKLYKTIARDWARVGNSMSAKSPVADVP